MRTGFRRSVVSLALGLLFASAAPGCHKASSNQLGSVDIPNGSTLASDRPVSIEISAAPELLGSSRAALEVARRDGKLLYLGSITTDKPLSLRLAVPTKDKQLKVKLTAHFTPAEALVDINQGRAQYVFH